MKTAMADPSEDDIPDSTTWGAHMRAIRRELAHIRENQIRFMELLGRVAIQLNQVQGDVTLLENQNISRHGEILSILDRLDQAGIPNRNFG